MKAELKIGNVNQIMKDTDIYEAGDALDSIAMVLKGKVRIHGYGICLSVGSGCFLGVRDFERGAHGVTYTAQTNAVIYVFPSTGSFGDINQLMQAKKEYAALMVSGLNRSLTEQEKAYEELQSAAESSCLLVRRIYQACIRASQETGAAFQEISALEGLPPFDEPQLLPLEKIRYYQACGRVPAEIQKAFYGSSAEICVYQVREQTALLHQLHGYCCALAEYLQRILKMLILERNSLYAAVAGFALTVQRAGQDATEILSMLDEVIDEINFLENVLQQRADVETPIDRAGMEEIYFRLLNPVHTQTSSVDVIGDALALVEDDGPHASELTDTMSVILRYGEIEEETAQRFRDLVRQFASLSDKESASDEARNLRRMLIREYYPIYEAVFLKEYDAESEAPLAVELFLRYGFLSERLLREDLIEELLHLDAGGGAQGDCHVYDMKEWLQAILRGEREPSKNEFDMDYEETLRDKLKNKEITRQQQEALRRDLPQKLHFEVTNMFRVTHRLANGQILTFVPFLYTECCTSLEKKFLSRDKVCAALNRLRRIDFSAYYREVLFAGTIPELQKEFIQKEVCPDIILMPTVGARDIMWQELSGRKRDTPGRMILPIFLEGDLDRAMIHLTGSFRWELCRTMQGVHWNNIQYKSLTSEYADFLQFYKKNRELSDDRKEKVKLQIQRHRNHSREIFASDYSSWMMHEAQGGMLLSKPVREILATYCPFAAEQRQALQGQPVFQNAMTRFERERAKKLREYDLKLRAWEKSGVQVPQEILDTKAFYER